MFYDDNYDYPDIPKDTDIDIPEGLTDREAIEYLAKKLTDTNKTITRLALILQDFQRIMEYNMNADYKILQNVEKDLYNHTHSFHSMLLIAKPKEENNNESDIP